MHQTTYLVATSPPISALQETLEEVLKSNILNRWSLGYEDTTNELVFAFSVI